MSLFFTGILIGIVSLIPGISGGTIILLRNEYYEISQIISNYQTNKLKIFYLTLGIIVGALFFSRIVEILFTYLPTQTMMFFFGLLLFQTIPIIKQEVKEIRPFFLCLGILTILFLLLLIPTSPKVITNYPKLTITFLLIFSLCGSLDGFLTILPGISGSMVMMIIGPYYLYKSYLANLSLTNLEFLIPLTLYFIFDVLGIYIGSKLSLYLLEKHRPLTMSIIIGFVITSLFIILPIKSLTTINIILTSLMALILSYIITETINYFTK